MSKVVIAFRLSLGSRRRITHVMAFAGIVQIPFVRGFDGSRWIGTGCIVVLGVVVGPEFPGVHFTSESVFHHAIILEIPNFFTNVIWRLYGDIAGLTRI